MPMVPGDKRNILFAAPPEEVGGAVQKLKAAGVVAGAEQKITMLNIKIRGALYEAV